MGRRSFGMVRTLKSGRHQASYTGPDGHRYNAASTFARKSDADAWLSSVQTEIAKGAWVSPDVKRAEETREAASTAAQLRRESLTFNTWADEWLALLPSMKRTPKTIQTHGYRLTRLRTAFGEQVLAYITPGDVQAWYSQVWNSDGPGVARPTYMTLSTCMSAAVKAGHIDTNPCQVTDGQKHVPVKDRERRQVATPEEVKALADAMPEDLRLAVLLAAWCQLREGEIIGLQRRDIDLKTSKLRVARQIQYVTGDGATEGRPKSAAGARVETIPASLLPVVKRHLKDLTGKAPTSLVFHRPGRIDMSVHPNTLRYAWNRARKAVGMDWFVFHDLRHTGLTIWAQNGATYAELLHRGGHSSLEVALRYQHWTEERDRELTEKMNGQILV